MRVIMGIWKSIRAYIYGLAIRHFRFAKFIWKLLPSKIRNVIRSDFAQSFKEVSTYHAVIYRDGQYVNLVGKGSSGVNIIGYPQNTFGLAHQTRFIGNGLSRAEVLYNYIDIGIQRHIKDNDANVTVSEKAEYKCNICVSGGVDLVIVLYQLGDLFKDKYNIHYVAWELNKYPSDLLKFMNVMHEFWAMSTFVQESLLEVSPIPVINMPYAVDFAIPIGFKREDFGLPNDQFLFIFAFDMSSMICRKNPAGVIKAFELAFKKEPGVGLVLKVSRDKNNKRYTEEFNSLMAMVQGLNIFVIDRILDGNAARGLISVCDSFVSLHRAEGFGIGMAEAMKLGLPVIATHYSGNIDFTTPNTACVVDYKLIHVGQNDYVFHDSLHVWAEPNLEQAAEYMKKLVFDKEFYSKVATCGKDFIDKHYNYNVIGQKFKERLKILGII